MMQDDTAVWLFSYGTLRVAAVQRAVFGRLLDGEPDALEGFALGEITIADAAVVATSGLAVHLILRRDPDARHPISGTALRIAAEDLAAVDAYEGESYVRIAVTLASGRAAYVYVDPQAGD